MNRSGMAAALLGAALALGGCGDEGTAASESTALEDIDACALLTAAEIEDATGITPGAPDGSGPASGPPMCNWPAQNGDYRFAANVLVAPSRNYASYDEAIADWRESAESMDMELDFNMYQEVAGPGTVNAWLHETGMLQAHRGDRMVQIYLHEVPPGRDRLKAATALAGYALARLD